MNQDWIIFVYVFAVFVCVLPAESDKYDAEVTVSTSDKVRPIAFTKCSQDVNVTVAFNGSQVPLRLRHNSNLPFQLVPTVILEGARIRKPNILLQNSGGTCFYHDVNTNAAISIKVDLSTTLLDGYLSFDHIRYHISPDINNALHHVVEELGFDHTDLKDPHFTSLRKKRAEKTHYVVQVLLFIDYAIYERWFEKSDEKTAEVKREDALDDIKYYFAHIVNDMDLRYQSIESPDYDIRLSISGFVIATTADASPWTENHREPSTEERDKAQIDTVLTDFTEWVNQHSTELPEFDSAMLLTGLDLYTRDEKSGIRNYTKVGQATVGTVCQYHRTSIIEDRGRFESAFTGAHELGHNLGAKHDGDDNDCLISDHYIMMPMSGRPDSLNYTNIYRFSSCSIEEIYEEVSDPSSECLLSLTSQYNQTAISTYLQELPGQRYDIHEQCKAAYGVNSYYCGAQVYSGDICKSLVCHDPTTGNCYILGDAPAAMGTTCGNKKWCYEGNCIYDDRAPTARDDCVFGDYGGLLVQNTKTCAQLIAEQPRMCYHEENRQLCCASCADIRNSENSGCEYGDQADWCSVISKRDCYKNDHACCETCPVYKTGGPGCEYGDKANGCSLAACLVEENLPLCCSTCGVSLGFPTPTTSSSTSTSTSTSISGPNTTSKTQGGAPGGNPKEINQIDDNNGADDVTEQTISSDAKCIHSNMFKRFLKLITIYIVVVIELDLCR